VAKGRLELMEIHLRMTSDTRTTHETHLKWRLGVGGCRINDDDKWESPGWITDARLTDRQKLIYKRNACLALTINFLSMYDYT